MPMTDLSPASDWLPEAIRYAESWLNYQMAATGEPATRTLAPDGSATMLTLGGAELLPEQAIVRELAANTSDAAPAAQP